MNVLRIALVLMTAGVASAANAQNTGVVTFHGRLVSSTCPLVSSAESLAVQQPAVMVTGRQANVGSTSGSMTLEITWRNCSNAQGIGLEVTASDRRTAVPLTRASHSHVSAPVAGLPADGPAIFGLTLTYA